MREEKTDNYSCLTRALDGEGGQLLLSAAVPHLSTAEEET
jgi:hypothetical protein